MDALQPGGVPDWDDDTTVDATPFGEEPNGVLTRSIIRVKEAPASPRPAAPRLVDAMEEAQLELALAIDCIEDCVSGLPRDPSIRSAAESLQSRVAELSAVRDALDAVYALAVDAYAAQLFSPDGPVAAYVRGVYLFACSAAQALVGVAHGLRELNPDWAEARARIEHATSFYFDGLASAVRSEMARLTVDEDERTKLEDLFVAAALFAHGLEKRFG